MDIGIDLIRHTILATPLILIQLCVLILPVKKADTVCWLIHCVKVG